MECTCPHCGKSFEIESQQKRAIESRWAKEKNPRKRAAAAKRQAEARWGIQAILNFGKHQPQSPGYVKHTPGNLGADYRFKGETEWKPAPVGDLIGKTFFVYGRR
ncbi:MAG: hypothetical protein O2960_28535 [Verrucomicrobia bacterium]|nr:hypothetical protein [Verrucomicrobiota bacterium]